METEKLILTGTTKSTWKQMVTPHGEVDVEIKPDGEKIYYPLKTEELNPLPAAFKSSHLSAMGLFHSVLTYIKKHQPNRSIPVTRKEFLGSGESPAIIKDLMDMGMLTGCLFPVLGRKGANTGSRACLYYTPQGRAFIRAKVEPSYALTDNTVERNKV